MAGEAQDRLSEDPEALALAVELMRAYRALIETREAEDLSDAGEE